VEAEEIVREDMSARPDMMGEVRFRVPLVIVIPIAALLLIAAATIGFSWVLLSIPPEAATAVALVTALNILGACAVIASKRLSQTSIAELLIVVLYPVIIGIVLAVVGIGEGPAEAEGGGGGGGVATDTMVAQGTAFDADQISLSAGKKSEFTLVNEDTVQHNIVIYEAPDEAAGEKLFEGDLVDGGSEETYTFPKLPKGEHFFNCEIHPTAMTGTVVVE
jgi:plastocyanin